MPEAVQGSLIEPVAPAVSAPAKPPSPPARRYELPAESPPPKPEAPKAPEAPKVEAQKEEAKAPSDEPDADKPEPTPEEAEKRRESRRFERRIDKATRRAAEAEARARLLEEQLSKVQQPQAQPADEAAPKLEQFDYDPEKYAKAVAEYTKKNAQKEFETNQRTAAQKARQEKLVSSWDEKVEKASDKYDDFQTVVGELKPTNALVTAIMAADPDVAYHLGKHPKEAGRIAELDPVEQILEIGRLESKLKATPEKPKAPSKAPEPIKPLSGAGSTATDVPSESDDMKAWIKKRQRQVHGRS